MCCTAAAVPWWTAQADAPVVCACAAALLGTDNVGMRTKAAFFTRLVVITASDQSGNSISSGAYDDATTITFSFAIKDGAGGSNGSCHSWGRRWSLAISLPTTATLQRFSGSNALYKLECDGNNGQAVSVQSNAGAFTDGSSNLALPSACFSL